MRALRGILFKYQQIRNPRNLLTHRFKVDTLYLSEYLEVLAMGTITAKQLKQKTGEVIKRIKSGERLTLTYRGKPLAVIEPTTSKDIKELNKICDSAKAWDRIESTLNSTNPEFKNWREATKWVRKRN